MILEEIVDLMEIGCKATNQNFDGMKVMELGNQRMKWTPEGTGKRYLLAKGVKEHISIDLNGKNGALRIDLSKSITQWVKYFDMVTNYGTAEHVENGIYECFQNIHDMTKPDGIMVHAGPPVGGCPWHSPYHYETWFFEKLAEASGYEHVISELRVTGGRSLKQKPIDRSLVCSVLIKRSDTFITKDQFIGINGISGLS